MTNENTDKWDCWHKKEERRIYKDFPEESYKGKKLHQCKYCKQWMPLNTIHTCYNYDEAKAIDKQREKQ